MSFSCYAYIDSFLSFFLYFVFGLVFVVKLCLIDNDMWKILLLIIWPTALTSLFRILEFCVWYLILHFSLVLYKNCFSVPSLPLCPKRVTDYRFMADYRFMTSSKLLHRYFHQIDRNGDRFKDWIHSRISHIKIWLNKIAKKCFHVTFLGEVTKPGNFSTWDQTRLAAAPQRLSSNFSIHHLGSNKYVDENDGLYVQCTIVHITINSFRLLLYIMKYK